jgi:hypothetical protein
MNRLVRVSPLIGAGLVTGSIAIISTLAAIDFLYTSARFILNRD